MTSAAYDFTAPELSIDPFGLYRRLREEAPVVWSDQLYGWVVTGHEPCGALLRDRRLTAARMPQIFAMLFAHCPIAPDSVTYAHHTRTMLFLDPPEHTRVRSAVQRGFTPRALAAYQGAVQRVADELLTRALADGGMDLQQDYARHFPALVIAELMGVPTADRERVAAWTDTAIGFLRGAVQGPEQVRAVETALHDFHAYVEAIIAERRARPREDMISHIVTRGQEEAELSDWEVSHQALQLVAAGQFTVAETLGLVALALLEDPAQIDHLRADPGLWRGAVEEAVRWAPPQAVHRAVAEPIEISGQTLKPGDLVYLFLGAANRDPKVFADPERFDVTRADAGKHLSFGAGAHFCLGASLARMELQVALSELLRRLPGLRLAGAPVWNQVGLFARALRHLPVGW